MVAWFSKPKYTTLKRPHRERRIPEGILLKCSSCLETIVRKDWEIGWKVCPQCNFHERLTPAERIQQLLDENSFTEVDAGLVAGDPLEFKDSKPYGARLNEARERTGHGEAVVSGHGKIRGRGVAIAVMDTNFMGGSMGIAAGEKIARTMERGLRHDLPVVLVCGSGGARMQEGFFSLMQMAKTSALAARLHEARLPLFTILTDPTTGGVTASFASLGDVIFAEPNALIGFAGPRVIEATIKQILPPGFQRAEFVADHGFVDVVCHRRELRGHISNLMTFFMHHRWEAQKITARHAENGAVRTHRPAGAFSPGAPQYARENGQGRAQRKPAPAHR